MGTSLLTAADLLEHAGRLRLVHPTGDTLADLKRLIEPIVQARLLVLEAEARGLADESMARELRRLERDALVRELERVEIREKIAVDDSAAVAEGETPPIAAELSRRQAAFLDTMKTRLHYTVIDSTVELFLARMQHWAAGATDMPGRTAADRFGFTALDRTLTIFTYDGGQFTIGEYADYMAGEPASRVGVRTERKRVERDLEQYFRHHAYAEVARARPDLDRAGIAAEVEQARERSLIHRLYQAEVALDTPPSDAELRGRADLVAEREEERYQELITRLKERYPVIYHEEVLRRLPLPPPL